MFIDVRNTGGREIRIRSIQIELMRDGISLGTLPAQNYFETPSSQFSVLFVPFSLKPGDTWVHGTNFFAFFDRSTEKLYRESESALKADIHRKLQLRPEQDKNPVIAADNLLEPFSAIFARLFLWQPGEYVAKLSLTTESGSASFTTSYRFTLYESDSTELRSHTDDYKFGGGLAYNVEKHIGVFVPLSQTGT